MTDQTPETPAEAPADDGTAAAIALFTSFESGEPPAPTDTPLAEEATPAEAEPEAEDVDPLKGLVAALEERKAKRTAEAAPEDSMAAIMARVEGIEQRKPEAPKPVEGRMSLDEIKAAIEGNAPAFLAKIGVDPKPHAKSVYESIVSPQATAVRAQMTTEVAQLRAEIAELRGDPAKAQTTDPKIQKLLDYHQQQSDEKIEDSFMVQMTANGDGETPAYPLLSKAASSKDPALGREYVLTRAYAVIDYCKEKGLPVEDPEILATMEKQLTRELRAFGPAETGEGKKRPRQGSSTITSDLASSGTHKKVSSEEEREALAIAKFAAFEAAG